jgi:hypothetical protein
MCDARKRTLYQQYTNKSATVPNGQRSGLKRASRASGLCGQDTEPDAFVFGFQHAAVVCVECTHAWRLRRMKAAAHESGTQARCQQHKNKGATVPFCQRSTLKRASRASAFFGQGVEPDGFVSDSDDAAVLCIEWAWGDRKRHAGTRRDTAVGSSSPDADQTRHRRSSCAAPTRRSTEQSLQACGTPSQPPRARVQNVHGIRSPSQRIPPPTQRKLTQEGAATLLSRLHCQPLDKHASACMLVRLIQMM